MHGSFSKKKNQWKISEAILIFQMFEKLHSSFWIILQTLEQLPPDARKTSHRSSKSFLQKLGRLSPEVKNRPLLEAEKDFSWSWKNFLQKKKCTPEAWKIIWEAWIASSRCLESNLQKLVSYLQKIEKLSPEAQKHCSRIS